MCRDPETPENGTSWSDGTYATFACDAGFNLVGASRIDCQMDGTGWSNGPPLCSNIQTIIVFIYTWSCSYVHIHCNQTESFFLA